MNYPVWINADIIAGPLNNVATIPVDPIRFFEGVKKLPSAVLSIGWTTRWGPDFDDGEYTKAQIQQMIAAIQVKWAFNTYDCKNTPRHHFVFYRPMALQQLGMP